MTDVTWADAIAMNDTLADTFRSSADAWARLTDRWWGLYRQEAARTAIYGAVMVVWCALASVYHEPIAALPAVPCGVAALMHAWHACAALDRVATAQAWRARCESERANAAERANLCRAWARVVGAA